MSTQSSAQFPPAVWAQFAALAYAGYVARGRGAVILDLLPLVSPGAVPNTPDAEKYQTIDELKARDWMAAGGLATLETYDPETQIVVVARRLNGGIDVFTLSPDNGPTPKALYEQLAANLKTTKPSP